MVMTEESCRGIMVDGPRESLQMKWLRFELNRNEPRGFHVFLERWNDEVLGVFYICDMRRADLGSACVPTLLYGGGARRPLNGLLLQRGGEKYSPRRVKPNVSDGYYYHWVRRCLPLSC